MIPKPPQRQTPTIASRIQASPLADSLRILLGGKPRAIEDLPPEVAERLPRAQGMVEGETLYLSPSPAVYGPARRLDRPTIPSMAELTQPDVRGTTLHEAGHLYQAERPAQQSEFRGAFPTYSQATQRAQRTNPREWMSRSNALIAALEGAPEPTPLGRSVGRLSSYAAEDESPSGGEAYAEAFANAWDFLSRTAATPTRTPRQLLAEYEAVTPGTGTIVLDLLKERLFSKHPYANGGIPVDRR